jgi:signal transduction histidine kinase
MKRLGQLTANPTRTLRLLVVFHAAWVMLMVGLAAWWAFLLKRTARAAADLQLSAGIPPETVAESLGRFNRMISWEAATFATLFVLSSAILIYFYVREQKRSRSLQTFFATFTHELKTPLTGIRLQSEAIEDHIASSGAALPQITVWARRLAEDVERLESQVERTLELARVEGGGALFIKAIALDTWLQSLARDSESEFSKVKIEISEPDKGVSVFADINALGIIAKNVLENARRYSVGEPARVEIRTKRGDGMVHISFLHLNSNSEKIPDKLGTLFQRGEKSRGSGIGLYLVKTLAQSMEGDAQFSVVGTSFCVDLKLKLDRGAAQ